MNNKKNECTYINGKIFTANPDKPYATAMVVRDGKVAWIGCQADLEKSDGVCVDLQGRRVLPGLIDAHLHPLYLANASKQIACTPPLVNSIEDLIKQVRSVRVAQGKDKWVEGWGYNEGKLQEGRSPSRWDLDQAAADVPVMITRTCDAGEAANVIADKAYLRELFEPQTLELGI